MPTTPLTLEYIAGFFDGEGDISPFKGDALSCRVHITQNHLGILEDIKRIFGGRISENGGEPAPCLRLNFRQDEALVLLRALLPHLRVKKVQAEAAIHLLSRISNRNNKPIDTGEELIRWRLLEIIQNANNTRAIDDFQRVSAGQVVK